MTKSKQILVVDDHFEILELLRSMLELSDSSYQVLGVPSAEEAFLELHRLRYDLLITDMRLPGMSGLELLYRIRPVRPQMPIIVITAYDSARDRHDAEALGVQGYFQKPLDADAFLSTVRSALYADQGAHADTTVSPGDKLSDSNFALSKRVQTLQDVTGAAQVTLATMAGDVLFSHGGQESPLDQLVKLAVKGLQNSLQLTALLGDVSESILLHHRSRRIDLYMATIGGAHCLVLLFMPRPGPNRLNGVRDSIRNAVDDLAGLLQQLTPALADDNEVVRQAVRADLPPSPDQTTESQSLAEPLDEPAAILGDTFTQSERIALFDLLNSFVQQEYVDLDAFWEVALDKDSGASGEGLSFDEAQQRGLIPPELDSQAEE